MDEENKKHLQLPNSMTVNQSVTPQDLLVFLTIKRFENWKTHEAYPSLNVIAKTCGCNKRTIIASIERLKQSDFIDSKREGRKNIYTFKKYTDFEPFSFDFLDKKDLSFIEKAYLIASQQFLFKDSGLGKTTYNSLEMSEKINMPARTIRDCDRSLQEKNYLSIIKTNAKDPVTGLCKSEKIFHLDELGQAIVFAVQKHEDDINSIKEDLELMKREMIRLRQENEKLKKTIL